MAINRWRPMSSIGRQRVGMLARPDGCVYGLLEADPSEELREHIGAPIDKS